LTRVALADYSFLTELKDFCGEKIMVVYKEPCFLYGFLFVLLKSVCRGSCYHVCMSDYNKMGKKGNHYIPMSLCR
jgi:hypothetical protein